MSPCLRGYSFPFLLLALTPSIGHASAAEHKEALQELTKAADAGDTAAFIGAAGKVLARQDPASVKAVLSAYATIYKTVVKRIRADELMYLHGQTAGAFGTVEKKEGVSELRRMLARGKEWQERLLAVDASIFVKGLDPTESCLAALDDPHPIVVRRALHYLARSKKVPVVEKIVKRYADLETKRSKDSEAQWSRTLLAFQSTLQRMIHVDLPAGVDYRNWFASHKDDPDLFQPKKSRGGLTGATLFGTPITGKYIVFVLDVSGSMLSTDIPSDRDPAVKRRPRTVVRKGEEEGGEEDEAKKDLPPSDRQRMLRAKSELSKVVKALAEDVRFNIVTFSSDVKLWKQTLVPASASNKKSAVEHIEALKAEGVTVTDLALEAAFAHLETDTIYLVSDGVPTHTGSSAGIPEDTPGLITLIHNRVEELNFLRGVRIFTLGFQLAEEEFLKKLATDNAGTYVRIE